MMNFSCWKSVVVVAVVGSVGVQAACAEDVRFVKPIPAMMITKSNKRIAGTLEVLTPRVILFRSDRGRLMKMPNYQVRYVRSTDGAFRYRPGVDRFTTVLKKAKAINLQLQIENDNRAERAPTPKRNTGMPGDQSEPDPGMGIGMGPGGSIPGRSRFRMPGSRFGRTPGMGRNRNFPPTQPGFPGGMPSGADPLDHGMPAGGAFPPGGADPMSPLGGTDIPEGMDPGIDPDGMPDAGIPGSTFPGSATPGSSFPGNRFPGNSMPGNSIPGNGFPDQSFPSPSVPTFPGSSGPNAGDFPTGSPIGGPTVVVRKQCMSCRREVPSHLTAGDRCPHCGVLCTYDATNGKRSSGLALGGGLFGGGALIALIVFVIVKLSS